MDNDFMVWFSKSFGLFYSDRALGRRAGLCVLGRRTRSGSMRPRNQFSDHEDKPHKD